MKKYKVVKDYVSPYPEPLIFKKGEKVLPGKEYTDNPNWQNWIWCEGQSNKKAWVPKQFLIQEKNQWKLNQDYDAMELSVAAGEELIFHHEINGFVKAEKKDGESGWVPIENLEFLENR